jgi:hypothetical protein
VKNAKIRRLARENLGCKYRFIILLTLGIQPNLLVFLLPMIGQFIYLLIDTSIFNVLWVYNTAIWAIRLLSIFVGRAGIAQVSLTTWQTGRAKFSDLFAAFKGLRQFLRLLPVCVAEVALYIAISRQYFWILNLSMFYSINAGQILFRLALLLFLPLLSALCLHFLYYAILLMPEEKFIHVIGRGLAASFRSIFRTIGMYIAIYWWVILVDVAIDKIGSKLFPYGNFTWAIIVLLLNILIAWFVSPYLSLAKAGLAEEMIIKRDQTTAPSAEAETRKIETAS